MKSTSSQSRRPSARPTVEQLESRQLLSVSVLPQNINLRGAQHGHGVFTVKVISDDMATTNLLKAASLTFTVGSVTLKPVRTHTVDLNGDGVSDLILKFRRSDLATLTAGQQTLTVAAGDNSTTDTETGTFNLFQPGSGNNGNGHQEHGHHGHGKHGNDNGQGNNKD
jgi:hypothetical protein